MVTVIINTYRDDESRLKRSIESYLKQDYRGGVQLVISTVEGDSSERLAEFYKLDIFRSPEKGIYRQLNNAISIARGDYFCYASGNDYAMPYKLRIETDTCLRTGKKVCYSSFFVNTKKTRKFHPYQFGRHLEGNFVSDCSLVSMDLVRKYTPWREKYGNKAFHDFWLRIYEGEGDVFVYNPVPTWNYIIDSTARHIKRRSDPDAIKENDRMKKLMLADHGVH